MRLPQLIFEFLSLLLPLIWHDAQSIDCNPFSSIQVNNSFVQITTNRLPRHSSGPFPMQYESGALARCINPNMMRAQPAVVRIPITPTVTNTTTYLAALTNQPIGYAINGLAIYASDYMGNLPTDCCNGIVNAQGAYVYKGVPRCLISNVTLSTLGGQLLGWAIDGFPIMYYPLEYQGARGLDACRFRPVSKSYAINGSTVITPPLSSNISSSGNTTYNNGTVMIPYNGEYVIVNATTNAFDCIRGSIQNTSVFIPSGNDSLSFPCLASSQCISLPPLHKLADFPLTECATMPAVAINITEYTLNIVFSISNMSIDMLQAQENSFREMLARFMQYPAEDVELIQVMTDQASSSSVGNITLFVDVLLPPMLDNNISSYAERDRLHAIFGAANSTTLQSFIGNPTIRISVISVEVSSPVAPPSQPYVTATITMRYLLNTSHIAFNGYRIIQAIADVATVNPQSVIFRTIKTIPSYLNVPRLATEIDILLDLRSNVDLDTQRKRIRNAFVYGRKLSTTSTETYTFTMALLNAGMATAAEVLESAKITMYPGNQVPPVFVPMPAYGLTFVNRTHISYTLLSSISNSSNVSLPGASPIAPTTANSTSCSGVLCINIFWLTNNFANATQFWLESIDTKTPFNSSSVPYTGGIAPLIDIMNRTSWSFSTNLTAPLDMAFNIRRNTSNALYTVHVNASITSDSHIGSSVTAVSFDGMIASLSSTISRSPNSIDIYVLLTQVPPPVDPAAACKVCGDLMTTCMTDVDCTRSFMCVSNALSPSFGNLSYTRGSNYLNATSVFASCMPSFPKSALFVQYAVCLSKSQCDVQVNNGTGIIPVTTPGVIKVQLNDNTGNIRLRSPSAFSLAFSLTIPAAATSSIIQSQLLQAFGGNASDISVVVNTLDPVQDSSSSPVRHPVEWVITLSNWIGNLPAITAVSLQGFQTRVIQQTPASIYFTAIPRNQSLSPQPLISSYPPEIYYEMQGVPIARCDKCFNMFMDECFGDPECVSITSCLTMENNQLDDATITAFKNIQYTADIGTVMNWTERVNKCQQQGNGWDMFKRSVMCYAQCDNIFDGSVWFDVVNQVKLVLGTAELQLVAPNNPWTSITITIPPQSITLRNVDENSILSALRNLTNHSSITVSMTSTTPATYLAEFNGYLGKLPTIQVQTAEGNAFQVSQTSDSFEEMIVVNRKPGIMTISP